MSPVPLYEYRCGNDACATTFEVERAMSEMRPVEICRVCGQSASRVLSLFSIGGRVPAPPSNDRTARGAPALIEDCSIENCGSGVHVVGGEVEIVRTRFRRTARPIVNQGGIVRVIEPDINAF
jgi:putative FmdB family regulatory protein